MSQQQYGPDASGQPTPAWGGYSQQDYVQPHVQQQVPPQWQNRRRQAAPAQPQWKPPEIGYWNYPVTEQERRERHRRPPYPSHRIGFPAELLGFSSRRRGRGPSFFQMLYLGTHPIALLISVFLIMLGIELWMLWFAFILIMWLTWCAGVTLVWLCDVAVSAMQRRSV